MKKIMILMFVTCSVFAQLRFEEVFKLNYDGAPFKNRIENSGIYSLSYFFVDGNKTYLKDQNNNKIYEYENEKLLNSFSDNNSGDIYLSTENKPISLQNEEIKKIDNFFNNEDYLIGKDGKYSNNNSVINIVVEPNKKLQITNTNGNIYFDRFYNNINFADLIGIDKNGNYFVIVEFIENDIPLKVKRELLVIDNKSNLINQIEIPIIKYLTIIKEFSIDKDGNLYHFLSYPNQIKIIKISGLNTPTGLKTAYPDEFNQYLHYNNFVTTDEYIETSFNPVNTELLVSRTGALKTAEQYVSFKYLCKSQNLAPSGVTAPDGDVVKTPSWLIVGWNAKVPYMWGGFSTLSQYYSGLTSNMYAGDINTAGVSSYSVGVDCSGFVSRCWQLSYHASTAYMPNISTQLSSWALIKPGDAVLKSGHVRLYVGRTQNGALRIAEASGRDWAVSYWSYAISDLGSYTPNMYNSMETDFYDMNVILKSCIKINNKVQIAWQSDTTSLKGYRLYRSTNGKTWTLTLDETVLTDKEVQLDLPAEPTFYRVSGVKNVSTGLMESNWSNPLGVSNISTGKNYLIVDGFNRNSGTASFQGPNDPFSMAYGLGLKTGGVSFDNVKNIALDWAFSDLSGYDGVFWFVGDESSGDESINSAEQDIIKQYLEGGGKFFICGSEIGYDLESLGTTAEKDFYSNYLKSDFIEDNSASTVVIPVTGSIFDSLRMKIGQTYVEDYPDVINPINGSIIGMRYENNKGAGIFYEGKFGGSDKNGKLVYLAFPLETTADDTCFNKIIRNTLTFFEKTESGVEDEETPNSFILYNSYPNPFNSSTTLTIQVANNSDVKISIFNILGQEIQILYDGRLNYGKYSYKFENNSLSSGIYIASFKINNKFYTHKLCLIK
ncbi:MAG: T9SS type A sorting domain-containing protein [bacterium]